MVVSAQFLKTIPTSVRWWVRPALFLAIGFHALVLLIPIPSNQVRSEVASEKPIEESALPEEIQVQLTPSPAASNPTPKLTPPKLSSTPSPIPASKQPQMPVARRQSPPAAPAQALSSVTPVRPAATPPPIATASTPPTASTPSPTTPSNPASPLATSAPTPAPELILPFANFPDINGAQTGCFGLATCRQIEGTNFRNMGQTLKEQMQAQGYDVTFRDDLEEAGRSVYEVSKNGVKRYLSILSSDLGTSIYILANQPLMLTDLQQTDLVQTDLATTLNQLTGGQEAIVSQFAYPELFFQGTTLRPEVGINRVIPNTSPEQLWSTLTTNLQAEGYTLSSIGQYSGGAIYEVTQGALTRYLNLVPTQDGTGTILVMWTSLPNLEG